MGKCDVNDVLKWTERIKGHPPMAFISVAYDSTETPQEEMETFFQSKRRGIINKTDSNDGGGVGGVGDGEEGAYIYLHSN